MSTNFTINSYNRTSSTTVKIIIILVSADSEIGLVAISLNSKSLGKIKLVNNQAAILFNYQRQELEKGRVNDLMP